MPTPSQLFASSVASDQELRWRRGERVTVETYLQRHPALLSDEEAVLALIYNEVFLREQLGEQPGLEEYLARFPHLADQLRLQFEVHQAIVGESQQLAASSEAGITPMTVIFPPPQAEDPRTPANPESWLPPISANDFAPALSPSSIPPGYEILGVLGRGGMGIVYRARQENLNRVVALKMILAGGHAGVEERQRFLTEAKAIAAVKHPGIVAIYDLGTHDGLPFFTMEFCDGGSLAARLARKPLPPREAATVVEQVARAVQAAHEAGVVHRDLKPGNVLLAGEGTADLALLIPKVTDFGLAKRIDSDPVLTATGAVIGTPSYMAPEQAKGKSRDVSSAVDVYALGAILYECLTGRPPFLAATTYETLMQVISVEPVPCRQLNPQVPLDLELIALMCLHKDPGRRYASAEDFATDVRRWLEGKPVQARPVGTTERVVRWARRHPAAAGLVVTVAALAVALVLVAVGFGLFMFQRSSILEARISRREKVEEAWRAGVDAEAGGRLEAAQSEMARALTILEAAPDEADNELHHQISERLNRVKQKLDGLSNESARKEFQERISQLARQRDQLFYHTLNVAASDLGVNRTAIRKLAPAALAPFGLYPLPPLHQAAEGLAVFRRLFPSEEQRRRVASWCGDALIIWADADERQALRLLETAEALAQAEGVPIPRTLYERRARSLAAAGEEARAEAARKQADRPPETVLDYFVAAVGSERAQRYKETIGQCETVLRMEPGYLAAEYLIGLCHLKMARWGEANASMSMCLRQWPDFFWPRVQRAQALVELKGLEGAENDLVRAAKLAKTPLEHFTTCMVKARLAMARERWLEARDELQEAIKWHQPGAWQAHVNLAETYRHLKDDRSALAEIGRAIAINDTDGRLYYTQAQIHLKMGNLGSARIDYGEAIRRAGKDRPRWLAASYVGLAYLKHQAREFDAALADATRALEVVKDYPPAYRQRADTHLECKRDAEAGRDLDAYLAGGGTPDALMYKVRGLIHTRLREYPQAALAFTRSLVLKYDPEVLAYRGWAHMQSPIDLALADFKMALEKQPNNADALCGLAQAQVVRGEIKEALENASVALKVGRAKASVVCRAASVYARVAERLELEQGRASKVREYENEAVKLVAEALQKVNEKDRPQFWQEHIETDLPLRRLRHLPEMARLKRSIGGEQ